MDSFKQQLSVNTLEKILEKDTITAQDWKKIINILLKNDYEFEIYSSRIHITWLLWFEFTLIDKQVNNNRNKRPPSF